MGYGQQLDQTDVELVKMDAAAATVVVDLHVVNRHSDRRSLIGRILHQTERVPVRIRPRIDPRIETLAPRREL